MILPNAKRLKALEFLARATQHEVDGYVPISPYDIQAPDERAEWEDTGGWLLANGWLEYGPDRIVDNATVKTVGLTAEGKKNIDLVSEIVSEMN